MSVVVMASATVGTARNWKRRVYTVAKKLQTASTAPLCRRPSTVPSTSAPSHQKSCLFRGFIFFCQFAGVNTIFRRRPVRRRYSRDRRCGKWNLRIRGCWNWSGCWNRRIRRNTRERRGGRPG